MSGLPAAHGCERTLPVIASRASEEEKDRHYDEQQPHPRTENESAEDGENQKE
jgi:hypothetical protein